MKQEIQYYNHAINRIFLDDFIQQLTYRSEFHSIHSITVTQTYSDITKDLEDKYDEGIRVTDACKAIVVYNVKNDSTKRKISE